MAESKPRLSDEETQRAGGEAAVKAAQKAKPGDTELSGAAPGIKAKTDASVNPDEVETFDEPASARRARRRADKRVDEIREIQRETQSRNLLENVPPEAVRTVFGTRDGDSDKDPGSVTFVSAGNSTKVIVTGDPEFRGDDQLALVRGASTITSTR
jgi:hypothetical protein